MSRVQASKHGEGTRIQRDVLNEHNMRVCSEGGLAAVEACCGQPSEGRAVWEDLQGWQGRPST